MSCPTYRRLTTHYYSMTDTPKKRRQLEAHSQRCPSCQRLLHQQKELSQRLTALPEVLPAKPVLPSIWQGIEARKQAASSRAFQRLYAPWAWGLAATAVLAIVLMMPLLLQHKAHQAQGLKVAKQIVGPDITRSNADQQAPLSVVIARQQAEVERHQNQPASERKLNRRQEHQVAIIPDNNKNPNVPAQTSQPPRQHLAKNHEQTHVHDQNSLKNGSIMLDQYQGSRVLSAQQPGSRQVMETTSSQEGFRLFNNMLNLNKGGTTRITLVLQESLEVKVTIYSRSGRVVKPLADEHLGAGQYEWQWNGTTSSGSQAASGIYFMVCQLQGHKPVTYKVMVVK